MSKTKVQELQDTIRILKGMRRAAQTDLNNPELYQRERERLVEQMLELQRRITAMDERFANAEQVVADTTEKIREAMDQLDWLQNEDRRKLEKKKERLLELQRQIAEMEA